MRFPLLVCLLFLCAWSATAVDADIVPRQNWRSASASATPTNPDSQSQTASRTKGTYASTATKRPKSKQTGLTKAAKIGVGIGVPLGVLAIAGSIAAYTIGKRRGRKRRVDDPTAGAGKKIQDPSPELNIPPPTPLSPPVAELPAGSHGGWWKSPFSRSGSAKKAHRETSPIAPQSPQELPA